MRTKVDIEFGLYDASAAADATFKIDPLKYEDFSRPDKLAAIEGELPQRYGTLEYDYFLLDGSYMLPYKISDDESIGIWSKALSGEGEEFAFPPLLRVVFTTPHSSDGITFRFDESSHNYCTRLYIKWFDASNRVMAVGWFYPDAEVFWCKKKVENYKKIEVRFYETSKPYRRLKLYGVGFGGTLGFGAEDIVSALILEEIDPTGAELPINTLDFELYSDSFKLLDREGKFSLLQQGQRVRVKGDIDGVSLNLGTFYLEEPSAPSDTLTHFACVDAVGMLDRMPFRGAYFEDEPLASALSSVLKGSGIKFALAPALSSKKVSGVLYPCSKREALQQIAFASGAVADCSRSELINVGVLADTPLALGKDFMADDHSIKQLKSVSEVRVTAHGYSKATEKIVFTGHLPVGTHTVSWQEPASDIRLEGAQGVLKESWAFGARISLAQEVYISIKGRPIELKTAIASASVDVGELDVPTTQEVASATLVGSSAAADVAARLLAYSRERFSDEGTIFLSKDLAPGKKIDLESQDGKIISGHIESLETDLTGGFLSKLKMSGGIK